MNPFELPNRFYLELPSGVKGDFQVIHESLIIFQVHIDRFVEFKYPNNRTTPYAWVDHLDWKEPSRCRIKFTEEEDWKAEDIISWLMGDRQEYNIIFITPSLRI